jgi:hypothetical protein
MCVDRYSARPERWSEVLQNPRNLSKALQARRCDTSNSVGKTGRHSQRNSGAVSSMVPAMGPRGLWKTTARPVEPSNVPNYFQVTALAHADATFSQYLTADRINATRLLRVFPASNPEFSLHLSNEHLSERTIHFEAIRKNSLRFVWFEKRSDCQRVYKSRGTPAGLQKAQMVRHRSLSSRSQAKSNGPRVLGWREGCAA